MFHGTNNFLCLHDLDPPRMIFQSRTGLKIRKVNERGETFKNEKEFT